MSGYQVAIVQKSTLVTQRGHNRIMRRNMRFVGRVYRNQMFPVRFTMAGYNLPFVDRRTRRYDTRKLRQVGHVIPNVKTGDTLRRSKAGKVRATKDRWTFRARASFPMRFDRRIELESISKRSHRKLRQLFRQRYLRLVQQPQYQTKSAQRLR